MYKRPFTFVLIAAIWWISGCIKEPNPPDKPDPVEVTKGLLVLNEGLINMNNASLTYYDFETREHQTDFFEIKNGRKLGDTGNDMAIYGNKLYVVLTHSSRVEVMDPITGLSLAQIALFNGSIPRQPRCIAFGKGKAFVCSFDGTVAVIDTITMVTEKFIAVGRNPDGIAVTNDKVYVSNSGGLDFPSYDNTVSVIDIHSLSEIKRIQVRINPSFIKPDNHGNLYVISRGNYGSIKSCLQVIHSQADELVHTFEGFEALNLHIHNDTAYVYSYDYLGSQASTILTVNLLTRQVISSQFISDGTPLETVYGIMVEPYSGDVFIADARGFVNQGRVFCFDKSGIQKFSFPVGHNPGKMVVVRVKDKM